MTPAATAAAAAPALSIGLIGDPLLLACQRRRSASACVSRHDACWTAAWWACRACWTALPAHWIACSYSWA